MGKVRLIAVLLALCMILTLLPAQALTAEVSASILPEEDTNVFGEAKGREPDVKPLSAELYSESEVPQGADSGPVVLAESSVSGTCGSNLHWNLDGSGTLTISGTGEMEDYSTGNPLPWSGYEGDIRRLVVEDGAVSIGGRAFCNCTALTSVEISDSVVIIGDGAFYGCGSLTDVVIPRNVEIIGGHAFGGCSSLSGIAVDAANPWYTSVGGVLFTKDQSVLSQYPAGLRGTSYVIPDKTTIIGTAAFSGCSQLTSITIPESVTSLAPEAFSGCSGLTSIAIPNSVSIIREAVFSGCSGLISVAIPDNVTSLAQSVFAGCSELSSVALPSGIASIWQFSFSGCSKLTDVYFAGTTAQWDLIEIEAEGNGPLTAASIHCSDSSEPEIVEIGMCGENLYWELNSEGLLTIDGTGAMTDVAGYDQAPWYYVSQRIKHCLIKPGATSIGAHAFDNSSLVSITIPDSITSIGPYAFTSCFGLTDITLPNGITSIGEHTFDGCIGLSTVEIPDSVTDIGSYAFYRCSELTSLTIPSNVNAIGEYAFTSSGLVAIAIPDKVSNIGNGLFNNCSSLNSVTLPDTIVRIGSDAFWGCSGLTAFTVPAAVEAIEGYAFNSCTGLTSITIPDRVASIGYAAFYGCSKLKEVFYDGTEEQWKTISIGTDNTFLTNADIHYKGTDRIPGLSSLSYAFENSYDGFGYPNPYYIPYAQYRLIFGNTVKAKAFHKLQYTENGDWSGNCYGVSATSGMFFQDGNDIDLSSFHPGALTPSSLALSDKNDDWNLTLREFIEAMQISQYADKIQADYARNTDLEELCTAVNAFAGTGDNPVIIAVMRQMGGSKSGHALVGYKIERVSNTTSRLFVYDCNYPGAERYITLTTTASGAFTGWYYHLNDRYDWGSAYKGCSISYIPYSDFNQIWVNRGKANAMCTFTVNSDVLIRDMDGNSVASIEDGELFTGRDDIFPVVHFGIMANGDFPTHSTTSILLPADLYTVERLSDSGITLQSAEPLEVAMLHVDQSASITTTAGKVTFAVDDKSGINYVGIDGDESSSTYDVTLNSTLADAYEEVHLTGTVLNKAMILTQVNGVLNVNGAGSGAKLLVDGSEVNLGAVSNGAVPVLSFVPNGGAGTMSPRTADQNGEVVLPVCSFAAPDGYIFRAWQINGDEYLPGEICVLKENTAATALWTPASDMAYVLQSVSCEENGVRVNIRNQSGSEALLIAVSYNENGKMLDCAAREILIPRGAANSVSLALKQANQAEIRIFVADRITYQPLSESRTIN